MDDSSFNIRVLNLEKIALMQLVQGISSVLLSQMERVSNVI